MSTGSLPERVLILAGGLGTRLAGLLPDTPKVLAPVAGRPFLDVLIWELVGRGLGRFVFLLGHRAEQVRDHLERGRGQWPANVEFDYSVEPGPLGTGGAVRLAAGFCERRFFLLNGDTYFDLDVTALVQAHERTRGLLTIAAAQMVDAGRYGRLEVGGDGRILRFREKDAAAGPGLINAGVYLVEPALLARLPAGRAVSLENEVFPALLAAGETIAASPQPGTFFDIGTPASYHAFADFLVSRPEPSQGRHP
jgi:NDP-sugar pyrophosphorylase family protein